MVDGFIVVDKPAGISSHDVVNRVRRILGTKKVGHTGTLDPFATGVLPVAVAEGTKAIQFLDEGEKEYAATLRLDTLDITGTVSAQNDFSAVTSEILLNTMNPFRGDIEQIPPMFSAIKQNGQPLYRLARKGLEVERAPRPVRISSLELLSFDPPFAEINVRCSRGTYIRTLADDIGRAMGCGACLQELRRTASGPFLLRDSLTIEELEKSVASGMIQSVAVSPLAALSHLPVFDINPEMASRLRNGQPAAVRELGPNLPFDSDGSHCSIVCNGRLVAVMHKNGEKIAMQRVFL